MSQKFKPSISEQFYAGQQFPFGAKNLDHFSNAKNHKFLSVISCKMHKKYYQAIKESVKRLETFQRCLEAQTTTSLKIDGASRIAP